MTVAEPLRSSAPLAAGLFGGARAAARRDEPLVEPLREDMPVRQDSAARRQSFSDLFRADGGQLHAA